MRMKLNVWASTISAGFFSVFICLAIIWQSLFHLALKTQFQLDPASTLYRMWVKNPVPIYLEIYLFNLTNAAEFAKDRTLTPNFQEVGPFVFEESREKVGISWNDLEGTVSFNQSKTWRLLPDSSRTLSLQITNLNPIASTIAHISRLWDSKLQRQIANTLINKHERLLVTASARDWIFDGIPDKFLEMFKILRRVTDIPIPYDKFGWFYDRNASSEVEGTFTIKNGKFDLFDVGMLVSWNNKTRTEHYSDHCALVCGSTGEIIPPLKPFQKELSVFASDICSYITLKYLKEGNEQGVDSYEYVGDESVFDYGNSHPENFCFNLGETVPSGSRNVSSCRFGSPAFISFPHFFLADPQYTHKISGMKPDEKNHRFSLQVEPKTGVPLSVNGAFQINFRVEAYPWCDEFQKLPQIYIPMLWFKQRVHMSEEYASMLKLLLFARNYGTYIFYALALVGLSTFLFVLSSKFFESWPCTRKNVSPSANLSL